MNIESVGIFDLQQGDEPFQYLFEDRYQALRITKRGKPLAVALPSNELVINKDCWLLLPTCNISEFRKKRSKVLKLVSEGFFIRVTRNQCQYFSLVPAEWFFDQQELVRAAR